MFDNRVGNGREAEDKPSTPLRLKMFTADQQPHIDDGPSDPDGDHVSIFALTNDSAQPPDLSDELTVEFLEMVRNWKRADDERKRPEQVRDIVEAVPSLFNLTHYAQLLNEMHEQMHQLIMKFLKIDHHFLQGV